MKIIVDSGSTKADWMFLSDTEERGLHTMGFNPVFHSSERIASEIGNAFKGVVDFEQSAHIYFYGAGCWDERRNQVVADGLRAVFPNANIEVHHDLLAAARATCGHNPGISCIIGTGSNTCLYDGVDVIDNVTNLGYLCGDEGSGTHLGKKLIRHYFYREFPKDLIEPFEAFIGPGGKQHILDTVYNGTPPNVYLASFTRFMSEHKDHPFIHRILYRSFAEFIDRHVRKYHGHLRLPVHFIGSIAYVFQDMLKIVLMERAMEAGIFIKQPIERLVDFHRELKD
jgi:N-acetylglucosamine kinase-like BadF-type ATPase